MEAEKERTASSQMNQFQRASRAPILNSHSFYPVVRFKEPQLEVFFIKKIPTVTGYRIYISFEKFHTVSQLNSMIKQDQIRTTIF